MTEYFKCRECGAVVKTAPFKWPVCKCHEGMYSRKWEDDFERATEDGYYEWIDGQEIYG